MRVAWTRGRGGEAGRDHEWMVHEALRIDIKSHSTWASANPHTPPTPRGRGLQPSRVAVAGSPDSSVSLGELTPWPCGFPRQPPASWFCMSQHPRTDPSSGLPMSLPAWPDQEVSLVRIGGIPSASLCTPQPVRHGCRCLPSSLCPGGDPGWELRLTGINPQQIMSLGLTLSSELL